jgi:hypothetical protein
MMRFVVHAALAALALCAPTAAQAQAQIIGSTGPIPLRNYPQAGDITAAPTTYSDEGFPGSGYYRGGYPAQDFGPAVPLTSVPPGGVTWVPGRYNWDPTRQTYVRIEGPYMQSPHLNAQWVPGDWLQTPTAWIWIDGRWN